MSRGDGFITLAAGIFEMPAIEDSDGAATISNRPLLLESAGRNGHRCSAAPKTAGESLLSQWQLIGDRAVVCHQQASAEAFFNRMEFVANGGLDELDEQRIAVIQQDSMQRIAAIEFLSEKVAFHTVCAARKLNDGMECGRVRENGSNAHDTFVTITQTSSVSPSAVPEKYETVASSGK